VFNILFKEDKYFINHFLPFYLSLQALQAGGQVLKTIIYTTDCHSVVTMTGA
jgi:hypothetical protein